MQRGVQMSDSMVGNVFPIAVVLKPKGIRQQRLGETKKGEVERSKTRALALIEWQQNDGGRWKDCKGQLHFPFLEHLLGNKAKHVWQH